MLEQLTHSISNYLLQSGFGQLQWPNLVMLLIGFTFIFLAIRKGFEPLLLVPIGFGILIGNIPYNTNDLSLGVYDGPVSEHELDYFAFDLDNSGVVTVGHEAPGPQGREEVFLDFKAAWDIAERQRVDHLRKTMPPEDQLSEAQRELLIPEPALPWSHDKLMHVLNDAKVARFTGVRPVDTHAHGNAVLTGTVVMVNSHERYGVAVRDMEEDPAMAKVVSLGQGRQVFVNEEARNAADKYPQLWSLHKQDAWNASVFWWLFAGVGVAGFYPPLIFLGVGALTDFGPMLANPKTLLLGAAAQFGIFGALLGAVFLGFDLNQAGAIGIIGGADGPTAIFTCSQLAPELLGAVALAAYSYMAMVPIIQPPIMKLLTTKEERLIRMEQKAPVSKTTKIIFPIACFIVTAFIAPGGLPLLGMLFFGNLLRESGVTERLSKTAQTTFIDIVTILLGVTVGAKTSAANFLTTQTIGVFVIGIAAFAIATAAGLLFAKLMNKLSKDPINPLIGAAGVSAVPMAARVAHKVGQDEDPQNFLLMHAMGPNVAGVIGSAVAAGVLLSTLN